MIENASALILFVNEKVERGRWGQICKVTDSFKICFMVNQWSLIYQFILMSDGHSSNNSKIVKTIILGQPSVGKSTLILKFAYKQHTQTRATVGIDTMLKKIQLADKAFTLQLWDTAGHERYRSVVYSYFSHAQAAVVVFDLTNLSTFEAARVWLQQICIHCGNQIPKILLGNKSDLLDAPSLEVTLKTISTKIKSLQQEFNCTFFAVSAFTNNQVEQSFAGLVDKIVEKGLSSPIIQSFKLNSPTKDKKRPLCTKPPMCC